MSSRIVTARLLVAGHGRLVATVALLLATACASASEPAPAANTVPQVSLAAADALAVLGQGEFSLASAFLPDQQVLSPAADAPGHELAEGLGVQVAQSRRAFRARALDWVTDRSVAVGHMADFLIGGADSGWHLTVDPRGDDEYQLQWKARFR